MTPDLACFAKATGGGLPIGAIGGVPEIMELVERGKVDQVGTFNGNPLTMAAARAALTEVLDPRCVRPVRRAERDPRTRDHSA